MTFINFIKKLYCINVDDQVKDYFTDYIQKQKIKDRISSIEPIVETDSIIIDKNEVDNSSSFIEKREYKNFTTNLVVQILPFGKNMRESKNLKENQTYYTKKQRDLINKINYNNEVNNPTTVYHKNNDKNIPLININDIVHNKVLLVNSVRNLLKNKVTDGSLMPSKIKNMEFSNAIDYKKELNILLPTLECLGINYN
ncbi:hypothetical protein H311_01091 [Anncaliia algerae PRA109]|nr:hypothetical protein H311_01091 [Anncaliia algerae PRA109]